MKFLDIQHQGRKPEHLVCVSTRLQRCQVNEAQELRLKLRALDSQ